MARIASIQGLCIPSQTVHLWIAKLDCSAPLLSNLAKTLSIDEAERADRFLFPQDRGRFIAARGILRDIISRYLGCGAAETRLTCDPNGKPRLRSMQASALDLRFNLSHSAGLALYGVTHGTEVGVDLELIRQLPWKDFAGSFFTLEEMAELERWPPRQRLRRFFGYWTRKEAYLKASGEGLSSFFRASQLSNTADEAPGFPTARNRQEADRWSVWQLRLRHRFAGALVTEGRPRRIRFLRWNWSCS